MGRVLKERERQEDRAREQQEGLAAKIEALAVTIPARAGADGRLYGSVTPAMVSEALVKKGMDIPEKSIVIEEPIKELGIYEIKAHLAPEIEAVTKLWVVEEE